MLQSHLDTTGDVQSAALVALHAEETPASSQWLEIYRDLLDSWRMWHHRARLDVARAALGAAPVTPQAQTYARCFYCKGPLCAALLKQRGGAREREPSMFGKGVAGGSKEARRQTVCPNPSCGKELPKCAVCLLPLQFQTGRKEADKESGAGPGSSGGAAGAGDAGGFTMWFSWCQTCTHGGHTKCLGPWAAKHNCCPVPGCDCQCGMLDSALRAATAGAVN